MSDYIDRQAAIETLIAQADSDEAYGYVDSYTIGLTLLTLPSADVQPVRHGKWIEEPNCMYRCSSCGNHYPSIKGYMDYCYCPSCGARMVDK